ncbi:hypothetical protein N7G274_006423 [Stereocaulon virgatum]|uniref:Uncharacterized protein n=1 Tax=Stereocaulon virgatum TaxID=373712 RepID=A0ABR4A7B1_9LECA
MSATPFPDDLCQPTMKKQANPASTSPQKYIHLAPPPTLQQQHFPNFIPLPDNPPEIPPPSPRTRPSPQRQKPIQPQLHQPRQPPPLNPKQTTPVTNPIPAPLLRQQERIMLRQRVFVDWWVGC